MKFLKNKHGRVVVVDSAHANKLVRSGAGFSLASDDEVTAWRIAQKQITKAQSVEENPSSLGSMEDVEKAVKALSTKQAVVDWAEETLGLELDASDTRDELERVVFAAAEELIEED